MNAEGKDVISLGIGSPDMPPSEETINVLCEQAKRADVHGYQPTVGIPELRKAMADWYKRWYNVELDAATEIQPLALELTANLLPSWIWELSQATPGAAPCLPGGSVNEVYLIKIGCQPIFFENFRGFPRKFVSRKNFRHFSTYTKSKKVVFCRKIFVTFWGSRYIYKVCPSWLF